MTRRMTIILRQWAIIRLIESSGGQMSFAEIGRQLDISRERARALARQAGYDARRQEVAQQVICSQCGSEFTTVPSLIRQGRQFCLWRCYKASRRMAGVAEKA